VTGDAATPPGSASASGRARDGLRARVISAVVLAPLALGAAYLGGWPFLIFWTIAACVIQWEWRTIVGGSHRFGVQVVAAMIGLAAVYAMLGRAAGIVLSLAIGIALEALLTRNRRIWAAAGVVYATALLVACVLLRRDTDYGFTAIVFLFGIVWATDIFGYFIGRAIGGPKLWPAVSPKKTWSGALGGALGAVAAGLAIASSAYRANLLAVGVLALLLSAVSQAGDLFESAVKRRFGVKDAGHVIPGHGGAMDRLDGFLAAAVVAAIIGIARGGLAAPARGLLVW
jgi:phosphatidate cytidylyltransferase